MEILLSIFIVIFLIFLSVLFLFILYSFYQFFRNEKVYKIRIKWLDDGNMHLHNKYSYDFMFDPNKHNWYGLKFPNERDYQ